MLKKVFMVLVYIFAAIGLFLVLGYLAVRLGLTNERGIIDLQREDFLKGKEVVWAGTEEWSVLDEAIRRDEAVIKRAAADSDVSARLIVANLVAEQLRLFFTEREAYKQFFYPLKILGPQSQFSWGVMGMKEDTAIQVEENLKNPASPFYPGARFENLITFPELTDVKQERFARMTDQKNHYWSYLYAGLYLKQIEEQWRKAGFPIDADIAVMSTLYNIGFANSKPKKDPQVGGAEINIQGTTYSFGGLAEDFYESDLLIDIFPR